ncbi:MAG TPA: Holliday junction resolvase RuvX [Candidatus Limnocylindrales bacterium]|nr:Holliday junction resolvase RuvX [Candidatus Limnocylindrales bacterium]
MTAILGVDLGERRIGIAIADAPGAGARPLSTIRRGREIASDVSALRALIDANGVGALVVGLPIDAAGHEGEQAARTRAWVDAVQAGLGDDVVIALQDERLTSHVAETRIGPMPRGRSGGPPSRQQRDAYRARVDREAAAIILQDFLDSRRAIGSARIRPSTMEPRP